MSDQNLPPETPFRPPTPSLTDSTLSPSPTISLVDLSEEQLKALGDLYHGLTGAARMRLEGWDADYFGELADEALMPYLPMYREHYDLPLIVG